MQPQQDFHDRLRRVEGVSLEHTVSTRRTYNEKNINEKEHRVTTSGGYNDGNIH